ncbi:LOW QUALITY PROTEIN: hypothetical protein U9M48_039625 [Paspalum notatum var. saurae]|uniref:Reverse transcriptase domain-containing protein n=1 Tax=Paspalum notatum var. saurae TaxID=547442 RepID=A0AAQ3UJZ3_PASNO
MASVLKRILSDVQGRPPPSPSVQDVEMALHHMQSAEEPSEGFVGPLPASNVPSPQTATAARTSLQLALDDPILKTLFTTPDPAILGSRGPGSSDSGIVVQSRPLAAVAARPQEAAAPKGRHRRRRTYNLSMVHRSARNIAVRRLPIMQRAQRNLCRKLGLLADDDEMPFDAALQEFLALFRGPLPQEVIAALNVLFKLEDANAEVIDEALMQVAGDGISDLHKGVATMQEEAHLHAVGQRVQLQTCWRIARTRGGILLLWDSNTLELSNFVLGDFHISATATLKESPSSFLLTVVYGPTRSGMRSAFLQEIKNLKPQAGVQWLILGDFNFTYRAADKNNRRLNPCLMGRVRDTLNVCDLREISLQNRKYTWSNERRNPTLDLTDFFAMRNGSLPSLLTAFMHSRPHFQIIAPYSYQITPDQDVHAPSSFKEVVTGAWNAPSAHSEPFHKLYFKLQGTAQALRDWSKKHFSDTKLLLHMALEVILRLDLAQENRQLSQEQILLRARLKKRVLGLAVIECVHRKQSSRLTNLKFGDANTKFFHRRANARRRKNFISRLRKENGWAVNHVDKAAEVQVFFESVLRRPETRNVDFNWDSIYNQETDLSSLDVPFTEQETKRAIDLMPGDKAPGPDGFTGTFLKTCWDIIKQDVLTAANAFHELRCLNLQLINSAYIVLIPKKDGAEAVADFRPISLIHSFVKIITKTLALRLASRMNEIVSTCQSAFIKTRSIHDNFMSVRSTIRRYHRSKTPALFVKLDIAKAFDSVGYLLTLLQRIGFPSRWWDWIAAILSSSTSRVLVNGVPNPPLRHGWGLRQGDPLSPLLFIIAIDPLQKLLQVGLRISLYADDAALFIAPRKDDVDALVYLLSMFGQASGLVTNFHKSSVIPIRCSATDLALLLQNLPARRAAFPVRYLGLPLTSGRLRKTDFSIFRGQDLQQAEQMEWNLTTAVRLTLVKSVLTSQAIYLLCALKPPQDILAYIDSKRRQFLWAGMDRLIGGKCKVNWVRLARPKALGGLGILHLDFFARALHLRWL